MSYFEIMYYLYIDESGDAGDHLDKHNKVIEGSSKFFTLAGITVDDTLKTKLNDEINSISDRYFSKVTLPENFKIHYHPLRNKRPPYDKLSDIQRFQLANDMFELIKKSDCHLLSVTINLDRHCRKYGIPADPKAYTILILMERFQDFLEEHGGEGRAIYEKFNKKARKKAERTIRGLKEILRFRHYKELDNIRGHVENGDPKTSPILQLTDFFAYAVWIKRTTSDSANTRWLSIKDKYYRLDYGWYKAGNVEI